MFKTKCALSIAAMCIFLYRKIYVFTLIWVCCVSALSIFCLKMNQEHPTWTVVQFMDDTSVEAVPSAWIQGDLCHWPAFSKSKLLAAIKKCDPLNTCWPAHKVKIFRNATYDNYMIARNKAKVAEETSDLNSESEGKRKRIQKFLSSSSEDSSTEESLLRTPPKMLRTSFLKATTEENIVESCMKRSIDTAQPKDVNYVEDTSPLNLEPLITEKPQAVRCYQCEEKDKSNKAVLQQYHILRNLMVDTLTEVKEIKHLLSKRIVSDTHESVNTISFFKFPGITFPINTDEEFDCLEELLCKEEEFKNAVDELSKLGGSSAYDLIKRILTLTLTNDQTLKYSWLGRKGKRKFVDLNIARLLISVVENAGLAKTKKETECAIQMWIRRASDRRAAIQKKL